MKVFIHYIRDYFKEDFQWAPHLIIGAFLAVSIGLNYQYDIYDQILNDHHKEASSIVYLYLFYLVAFVFSVSIVSIFSKKKEDRPIFNKKYLLFSLIGILFLSLDCSYYLMQFSVDFLEDVNPYIARWVYMCLSNLHSLLTIIIPLFLIYFAVKHFKPELYGLRLNGAKVKPYFWLILLMIPLIYLASFQPDFLEAYPSYEDYQEYKHLGVDQWVTAGTFELCYGFDFLSVELFFRGFLVIALSRFVGRDAILPMVTLYCFLHFGKPAGETISSIFGGYILGILAYRSRNIYGGLIAHLGVAWGMELMAYLQG
ncbi:MAG: CPBP family intramembrane metalloprotease [Flavobacteriales bacterium]|nr:CPBP family intramembrane metalloprotease [Flavobacteriales bacterium]